MRSHSASELHGIARRSIESGVDSGLALLPQLADCSGELRSAGASFVTLRIDGRLRGCVGSLQAVRPLALDVAANAFGAAFRDPRFPPVGRAELPELELHISVLAPPEPLPFDSLEELVEKLRPGVDGLILEAGDRRATFLPAVWTQLPEPPDFVDALLQKAGIAPDEVPAELRAHRYTAESIPAPHAP